MMACLSWGACRRGDSRGACCARCRSGCGCGQWPLEGCSRCQPKSRCCCCCCGRCGGGGRPAAAQREPLAPAAAPAAPPSAGRLPDRGSDSRAVWKLKSPMLLLRPVPQLPPAGEASCILGVAPCGACHGGSGGKPGEGAGPCCSRCCCCRHGEGCCCCCCCHGGGDCCCCCCQCGGGGGRGTGGGIGGGAGPRRRGLPPSGFRCMLPPRSADGLRCCWSAACQPPPLPWPRPGLQRAGACGGGGGLLRPGAPPVRSGAAPS